MDYKLLKHFDSLESALHSVFGAGVSVVRSERISGGDINEAYGLTLSDGNRIFMKKNAKENISFFDAEAAGLYAISHTDTIRTPQIFCAGTDSEGEGFSFLLMEFISGKNRINNYWETFAHELADMHNAPTDDFVKDGLYGFIDDNYIGSGGQMNEAHESFVSFFRECRLEPQFKRAEKYFDTSDLKKITKLLDGLDNFLVEPTHPSLLHGDLWGGNFMTGNDGRAWLIDPAAYVGHAEADIAMTELFGGFSQTFYHAYREAAHMQPGYERRRDLYNLYHLLNHLNLFGTSYLSSVKRTVAEYV